MKPLDEEVEKNFEKKQCIRFYINIDRYVHIYVAHINGTRLFARNVSTSARTTRIELEETGVYVLTQKGSKKKWPAKTTSSR